MKITDRTNVNLEDTNYTFSLAVTAKIRPKRHFAETKISKPTLFRVSVCSLYRSRRHRCNRAAGVRWYDREKVRDCWSLEECDEDREGELEREYGYRRSEGVGRGGDIVV